jgi:tetratricopeptide (TPR) repeat protein
MMIRFKFIVVCFFLVSIHLLFAQSADQLATAATLALRENRYEEAISFAAQASEIFIQRKSFGLLDNYLTHIRALIHLGRYDEAIVLALTAHNQAPYDYRFIQALGEGYYLSGDGLTALPYLQQYVAVQPTGDFVGRVYYYMGEIYLLQGRYEHADIAFSTAVYHSPQSHRWWYRLGYAREQAAGSSRTTAERLYLYILARTAYEKVLVLSPSHTEARESLSIIQAKIR